jgi:hypothetical protein
MGTTTEDTSACSDARECIRNAKTNVQRVKELLARPSTESAEQSSAILREVEVQLGCAAAILQRNGSRPDQETRLAVEELQDQVAVLAKFFAEADNLLSGWLRAVRSRHGGYTKQGRAAPLILVNKLTVQG